MNCMQKDLNFCSPAFVEFFFVVAVNVQVLGCDEKKGIPSLDRFNCQIS